MEEKIQKLKMLAMSLIKGHDDRLEERFDGEVEGKTAYDLGLDSDGMPLSHGNSDDVYSDGFDAGGYDESMRIGHSILAILDGEG